MPSTRRSKMIPGIDRTITKWMKKETEKGTNYWAHAYYKYGYWIQKEYLQN